MNRFKYLLIALGLLIASQAQANNCFWVGGTGTWDNAAITHWAPTTGAGATGCSTSNAAPTTGDSVTFDGSSGGGTVTASGTISGLSLANITMGAFTGTLDFSANNPSLTITTAFSVTGAGTRTLNLGSGTFTLAGTTGSVFDCTTITGLTLNAGTSTIALSATLTGTRVFAGCTKTFSTISIAQGTNSSWNTQITGNVTVGTLSLTAPLYIQFGASNTITVSNTFTWAGTSAAGHQFLMRSTGTGPSGGTTIAVGSAASSISWSVIQNIAFTTNSITASNSFDLGSTSGVTINPPIIGGGGHIIGG